jgi:23S rRNA pseudouridine1911/1915/1917 synthase
MSDAIKLEQSVPISFRGMRLDQAASELFGDFSRSRLQVWIKKGDLLVNGNIYRPKDKLLGGELLSVSVTLEPEGEWKSEAISLDIVFEDEDIIALNKPAGLVVHPAAGNYTGTLLNGLIHHAPSIAKIPRAGIVHRLDKDTTGLMVVAKTLEAHHSLVKQLQARTVSREYQGGVQLASLWGGILRLGLGWLLLAMVEKMQ